MNTRRAINSLSETAARSQKATRIALKVRNVATLVVARRLAPSIEPDRNGEYRLLTALAPDISVAIDVGANVGDWSAMAAATCPSLTQLVCYEPSQGACEQLRQRFGRDPRVTLVSAAVSDRAGQLEFYEEPDAGQSSSVIPTFSQKDAVCRTVKAVRLDDELERLGIDQVDFLKVDAEGFDLRVLKGAKETLGAGRVGMIQFEYNSPWIDAGCTLRAATDFLESVGYHTLLLTPRGLHHFDADEVGRLLSYSNFVGLSAAMMDRFAGSIHADW